MCLRQKPLRTLGEERFVVVVVALEKEKAATVDALEAQW